jgi:hypothetical protein
LEGKIGISRALRWIVGEGFRIIGFSESICFSQGTRGGYVVVSEARNYADLFDKFQENGFSKRE